MDKTLNATFTYLTTSDWTTFFQLFKSIFLLKKNCKWGRKYNITIFHERDYKNICHFLIKICFRNVKYVEIDLETPEQFKHITYHDSSKNFSAGYRNMCRFFNSEIFNYLDSYQWYCRLDTDSFLTDTIEYDFFELMYNKNIKYGYIAEVLEAPEVTIGISEFILNYNKVNNCMINNKELIFNEFNEYSRRMYYTNFEVIDLSFFKKPAVRHMLNQIDITGNIFRYRWGDAPLRTFLINNFLNKNEIIRFDDINYIHLPFTQKNGMINCPYTSEEWIIKKKWLGILKTELVSTQN